MFTVYILYSSSLDKYYIGYTADRAETRLAKHLANHSGFTGKAKDWIIAYKELYDTKEQAVNREKRS